MGFASVLFLFTFSAYALGQALVEGQNETFSVELLIVVDKKGFDKWFQITLGATENERNAATVNRIRDFLSSIVVGINTLYQSVNKYGLLLDVRLKKIHILKHDLWGKDDTRFGYEDQVASNKAIDTFYNWSWKARDTLGTFDHAMLITGYDIIDPKDPNKLTKGVAYKGVMCKYGSVSVVENTFSYQMVDTTAHELGHSLGCDHDGENNYCENSMGHVMSSRTEINSTNRWSFSPCSSEAIKHNIAQLNRINANCLTTTPTKPTPGIELGSFLTPDEQCKLMLGPEAFFCRDFYNSPDLYEKMCTSMWCSASQKESHCQNHIAADGFVCGTNKVCQKGRCIATEDPLAAGVSDWCPQGDQPGLVFESMTCADVVRQKPWLCYQGYFQRKCCLACPSIQENNPTCEYGDKEGWCKSEMNYPFDCYLNEAVCCKSCSQHRRNDKPGCEFGDRSLECTTKLSPPLGCYKNEDLCCETCAKLKIASSKTCPYGDKSTWCKTDLKVPNGCYLNQDLCCGTCATLTNETMTSRLNATSTNATATAELSTSDKPLNSSAGTVAGCLYGDQFPDWCKEQVPHNCYNSTYQEWCCQSCEKYFNESNVGCEYGDRFKNCDEIVFPYSCSHPRTNAQACCGTCRMYYNESRPDCPYGDKEAWCYTLNDKYTNEQWCHLDKEAGHCCGTCRYNETAIPVFGKRVKAMGLPTPK